MKIPVSKFVDASAKPDDAKLQLIYNEGKARFSDASKGVFGFMEPARVDAEYLVADASKFLDKAVVTDPEVKEYYDTHKAEFTVESPQSPVIRNLPGPPTGESVPIPAPPKEKPKAAETGKAKPADSKPADSKPAAPEKKADATKKTSSLAPGVPSAVAALTAATPLLQEAKPAEKPVADKAPAPKPAEKPAAKTEEKPSVKAESKPAEKPAPPAAPPAAPAVKYKPFDEVKGQIREQLKKEKATALAISQLRKILNETMAPYQIGRAHV